MRVGASVLDKNITKARGRRNSPHNRHVIQLTCMTYADVRVAWRCARTRHFFPDLREDNDERRALLKRGFHCGTACDCRRYVTAVRALTSRSRCFPFHSEEHIEPEPLPVPLWLNGSVWVIPDLCRLLFTVPVKFWVSIVLFMDAKNIRPDP